MKKFYAIALKITSKMFFSLAQASDLFKPPQVAKVVLAVKNFFPISYFLKILSRI